MDYKHTIEQEVGIWHYSIYQIKALKSFWQHIPRTYTSYKQEVDNNLGQQTLKIQWTITVKEVGQHIPRTYPSYKQIKKSQ